MYNLSLNVHWLSVSCSLQISILFCGWAFNKRTLAHGLFATDGVESIYLLFHVPCSLQTSQCYMWSLFIRWCLAVSDVRILLAGQRPHMIHLIYHDCPSITRHHDLYIHHHHNPLKPFKLSRCIKASFRISEEWLNFLKPGGFRTKIFMKFLKK